MGVSLDSELNFTNHVTNITRTAFYHPKNKIKSVLSQSDAEKQVHAFISSRLDYYYCDALFAGLPKKCVGRLQILHNAAARVLTGARKTEHITLIVYKSLNGVAPANISDLFTASKPSRTLRSPDTGLLTVPRIRSKSGEGAFSYHGPTLWGTA